MNNLPNDDPVGGVILKFREYLKSSGYSTPTVKNYLADLNQFLSWGKNQPIFKPAALTKVDIQLYASYLKETFKTKPSIVSRRISSLRKFLYWASKEGLVAAEVLAASRQPKESAVPFVDDIATSYRANLKERKFSAPTVKNYVADVRAFLLWLKGRGKTLQNLKQSDIESYTFYLDSSFPDKPSIVSRKTSSLHTFLSWAKEEGLVKIVPAKINIKDFLADELKRISSRLPSITFHKKLIGRLGHDRPDWYHRYHRWEFSNALHYAILAIYLVSIGAGLLYFGVINPQMKQTKNEFKTEVGKVLAAASPPRILSFQGRLTDSHTGLPTVIATGIRFRIYTSTSGDTGDPCANTCLWESSTRTVTPDQNGIFSVTLGDSNDATPIPSNLFTDNDTLYLGVRIMDGVEAEMTPRQRIASSSYALNSDALEGYHGSQAPGANQVPILDGSGNLMFAGASTIGTAAGGALTLDSDSGTLALGSGTTIISSAGALTLNSATTNAITLDSGTTGAVNIGNNANAKTINIGNATGATLVNIDSGTGGVTIDSTGTGDIVVNSTDTLLLDSAGILELNSSAGIISIGNDAVAQNINIGTGAAARTLTIGNNTTTTGIVLTKGASGEITLTGYNASCTALETDADGHLNCGTDDGAGSIAFSAVTAGTNTNALVIGTGGSLGTSGSGTITATDVVCTDCIALTSETSGNYVAYANTSALTGLTGGSSGSEGATLSLALDESQVLSGDPVLSANTEVFGVNGIVFEGATANTFETFLAVTDPTADRTITFPNASGTVAVSATSPISLSALGDISVALATVSTTGIASFNDSYFGVSSGAVSIDDIYLLNSGDTSTGLLTLTGVPTGTGVDQGSLYINPASATSDYTLLGLAVAGVEKLRIDEDGDIDSIGHLAIGDAASISTNEIISVKGTFSTGTPIGIRVNPTLNTDVSYAYGIQVDPIKNDANVTSGLFGIKVLPTISGSGQVPSWLIGIQTSWSIGASTVGSGGSGYGMQVAAPTASKLNVVGTAYGINIQNQGNTNIGTASYGLYVADQTTAGGPSEYGIAIAGADTYALWLGSGADNTDAANGITFGQTAATSANLYRSADNTLKTDDNLLIATHAAIGNSAIITTGHTLRIQDTLTDTCLSTKCAGILNIPYTQATGSVNYGIYSRAGVDTNVGTAVYDFYAEVPNMSNGGSVTNAYGMYINSITTGGSKNVGLAIADAGTYSLQLASVDGDAASGITFGTDTNLYRGVANGLRTDDQFQLASNSTTCTAYATGGAESCIWFYNDTNLYRSAGNTLKTDDDLNLAANLIFSSATPNISLSAADNTAVLSIKDASSNTLLQFKDLSTNFGGLTIAGAFAPINSYFGEEYTNYRSNTGCTADTIQARGAGTTAPCTANTGVMSVDVTLGSAASCTVSSVVDSIGGFERLSASDGSGDSSCLEFIGSSVANDAQLIFKSDNLPVVAMKVRASATESHSYERYFVGIGNLGGAGNGTSTAAQTAMDTSDSGVYFSNCSSPTAPTCTATTWQATLQNAAAISTVDCGVTIANKFAYMRIEVVVSGATPTVNAYVDGDASDGISETKCPAFATVDITNLAWGWFANTYANASLNGTLYFDIDYVRVWQDDAPSNSEADNNITTTEPADAIHADAAVENAQIEAAKEAQDATSSAKIATPINFDSENNLIATISAKTKFIWADSLGKPIAWITDTGETVFEKVTALVGDFRKLVFGELVASKDSQTAGQASFEPDQTEVFIASDKVAENSLIYVAATTKTAGVSLYIKEQKPSEGFTVALERSSGDLPEQATASATQAIKFNWLIVNQEK